MKTPDLKAILADAYLDYVNDFITSKRFAEYFNLPEDAAHMVIDAGRICHESRVKEGK